MVAVRESFVNPRQIDQIRDSFIHVLFEPERASRQFYDRLFALAPEIRALFTRDMETQGRILIQSLSTIVTGLARFDAIGPRCATWRFATSATASSGTIIRWSAKR